MPDRINPDHPRRVEALLLTGTLGVVFLTVFVIYSLFTGNPEADKINAKLDRQLELLQEQVDDARQSGRANACTAYLNHRAIELALLDIAELNGIAAGKPRVLPSQETVAACKAVGVDLHEPGEHP